MKRKVSEKEKYTKLFHYVHYMYTKIKRHVSNIFIYIFDA